MAERFTDDLDTQIPFASVFDDLIRSQDRLISDSRLGDAAGGDLRRFLTDQASRLAALAVNECWADRPSGWGYERFVRAGAANTIDKSFPILSELLEARLELLVSAALEMLDRLERDWLGEAGAPVGIRRLALGLGDAHCGGRQVVSLRLENDRVLVYKPRSVAPESWFYQTMALAGITTDVLPEVVEHDGYGWIDLVEVGHCTDPASYWRATGAMMRLAQLVGMTDLHHSNLIGRSDVAVPIDAECILQPDLFPPDGLTFGGRLLHDSVMSTGLVPSTYTGQGRMAIDWTGLIGQGAASNGERGPAWTGLGSDELDLRTRPMVAPRARNRPLDSGGEPVSMQLSELLAGYATQFDQGLPDGVDPPAETMSCRYIIRPTATYAARLWEARQPANLGSWSTFDDAISALPELPENFIDALGQPAIEALVSQEVEALRRLDIPIVRCSGHDLVLEDGTHLNVAGSTSGLERLRRREATSTDQVRDCELKLLTLNTEQRTKQIEAVTPPDAVGPSEFAHGLGRQLLAEGIAAESGQLHWFEPTGAGSGGQLGGSIGRRDLYYGSSGVALFLAALYEADGNAAWKSAARQCFVDLLAERSAPEVASPWFDTGWAGELWAAHSVSIAIDDHDMRTAVEHFAKTRLEERDSVDLARLELVGGWSGTLHAISAIAHRARSTDLSGYVGALAQQLVGAAEACDSVDYRARGLRRLSVAHGSVGLSTAVLSAGMLTDNGVLIEWAHRRIEVEEQRVAKRGGIGAKIDHTTNGPVAATSWCWGAAGYLLARHAPGSPGIHADHLRVSMKLLGPKTTQRPHLCCGLAGQLEAATMLRQRDVEGAAELGHAIAAELCRDRLQYWEQTSVAPASVFRGRAGVGLALLRHIGSTSVGSPVNTTAQR